MCLIFGFEMSFVIIYNILGNCPITPHTLTGIIDQDGSLHWLCTDVRKVLGVAPSTTLNWSDFRIKDVTGLLDNVEQSFLKRRIILHEKLTESLKHAKWRTVRDFEKKLNSSDSKKNQGQTKSHHV